MFVKAAFMCSYTKNFLNTRNQPVYILKSHNEDVSHQWILSYIIPCTNELVKSRYSTSLMNYPTSKLLTTVLAEI